MAVSSLAICSASSCFLARILDNPCLIHKNSGVPSTPPRFFARRILGGGCGLRDPGGNAPEDHGCGLLNGFQTLPQQVGISVPNLYLISGGTAGLQPESACAVAMRMIGRYWPRRSDWDVQFGPRMRTFRNWHCGMDCKSHRDFSQNTNQVNRV